jgi:hypothetical protein
MPELTPVLTVSDIGPFVWTPLSAFLSGVALVGVIALFAYRADR